MANSKNVPSRDLARAAWEACNRAARAGFTDTAHAIAGIVAMIATLEAEAREGGAEGPGEATAVSPDRETPRAR